MAYALRDHEFARRLTLDPEVAIYLYEHEGAARGFLAARYGRETRVRPVVLCPHGKPHVPCGCAGEPCGDDHMRQCTCCGNAGCHDCLDEKPHAKGCGCQFCEEVQ